MIVTDSGGTIRVVTGTDIVHVNKKRATIQAIENNVRIQWEEDCFVEAPYTDFTAPSGGSANAVADAIAAFLDTGV